MDDSIFFAAVLYEDDDVGSNNSILSTEKDIIELNDGFCSHDECDNHIRNKGLCILHMGRLPREHTVIPIKPPPVKRCFYCGKQKEKCICECISCGIFPCNCVLAEDVFTKCFSCGLVKSECLCSDQEDCSIKSQKNNVQSKLGVIQPVIIPKKSRILEKKYKDL